MEETLDWTSQNAITPSILTRLVCPDYRWMRNEMAQFSFTIRNIDCSVITKIAFKWKNAKIYWNRNHITGCQIANRKKGVRNTDSVLFYHSSTYLAWGFLDLRDWSRWPIQTHISLSTKFHLLHKLYQFFFRWHQTYRDFYLAVFRHPWTTNKVLIYCSSFCFSGRIPAKRSPA